ncbi:protein FAM163A [Crotalus tigris]|uniref:protein FAM163A n=1 Tax=Crotalus tigris TaxID=88082 RepID=UPI00192F508F|nr:protein FAM163A [Crotalus tigris]XP_039193095.1 protein FAM163A [Crotalus tigris]XP_039193096.1 protein FAM163A [Crotalus tigris]
MTAGTVVITGGILATVILFCIIAVLCYCRLQYYCCKKDESEEAKEEEEEEEAEEEEVNLPLHSHYIMCNACNCRIMDGQGNSSFPLCELNKQSNRNYGPVCSPCRSPFYIRTGEIVQNGGENVTYTPICCKDMGLPANLATHQNYPVIHHCAIHGTFPNLRAFSTEV